ncbi:MAG: ABC transporter substrate-binding protein [Pseudomonadota bacterium]
MSLLFFGGFPVCSNAGEQIDSAAPYTLHLYEIDNTGPRPDLAYFDTLARTVFDQAGLPHIEEKNPWKRAYQATLSGPRQVIYPTTRTPDREDLFAWVGPVSRTVWSLYGLSDGPWRDMPFENVLSQARIGVAMGAAREDYLQQRGVTNLVSVPRQELLVPMLMAQRLDLVALGISHLRADLATHNIPANRISSMAVYRICYLYLALSRDTPSDHLDALQKSLNRIKESGEFAKIRQKFGLESDEQGSFMQAMMNRGNDGLGCVDVGSGMESGSATEE